MADVVSDSNSNNNTSSEQFSATPFLHDPTSSLESFQEEETSSYPPIHSLLLCPAQWTALLESPVSLVRGVSPDHIEGMDSSYCTDHSTSISISGDSHSLCSGVVDKIEEEEEDEDEERHTLEPVSLTFIETNLNDDNESEKEERPSSLCHSTTSLERSSPIVESTSARGEDSQSDKEVEESFSSNGSSSSSKEDRGDEEGSTMEQKTPATPAHVLPTIPSTLTTYCVSTTSEGTCTIEEEEEEEGGEIRGSDTPSLSEKSSVPSTPLDSRFPIHFTHSRNVSETPSLPPFISSSSSSAYHSRNSSMASQITSDCFETDSQFTDIDSCIVTYSSDIHSRPISLQESRFKFPEMSAMEKSIQRQCYSIGDINVTTPICVPEHLFDETLTTTGEEPQGGIVGENFEGKKIGISAIKSSEWIKKEMRRSRQTMIQVKVSSKSRHFVHFNVKAGDMFLWEFATKRKDIAFGLSFEATEVATVQEQDLPEEEKEGEDDQEVSPPPPPLPSQSPDMKMVPILPVLRVNTHTHPVIGSHTATQDGVYELLFDNSYSRFFAKELYYRITTKPSIPNEHYLNQ